MNLEKWEQIKAMAKDKFEIIREIGEDGVDGIGNVQILEFNGPLGRMKLEFVSKPRILDKKTSYSNRIGSGVRIDYVYSEDEEVHELIAYKWDEVASDWESIDASDFT